jgi:hypothetical protein
MSRSDKLYIVGSLAGIPLAVTVTALALEGQLGLVPLLSLLAMAVAAIAAGRLAVWAASRG